ncbi:MAG: alkaline phosphatase family protein [Halobacteriaceae archaeon]
MEVVWFTIKATHNLLISSDMNHPTIIFGLDGACFELLQPWIGDGTLPTIQNLIKRGGQSAVESSVPSTTPPAWTSLTTGVNPGKHGVFGFYTRQKGTYDIEPVSNEDIYARRLWDYASIAGFTSLVINVPVTHPGRKLNGVIVPGYLARDTPRTHPPDILEKVEMNDYHVYAESEGNNVPEEQLLDEWLRLTDSRRELTVRLMDAYEWDLLFLEFQKTDSAVHKFDNSEKIRQIYERVDKCMADILGEVEGEANVLVVSDHGIGQEKDWSIGLNTLLVEKGYAETKLREESNANWREQMTGYPDNNTSSEIVTRILQRLGSVGITKQQLERVVSKLGLYDVAARLAPKGFGDTLEEIIDHEQSVAFYEGMGFSGVDVGIIINDKQFYPNGTVGSDEYESTREELMTVLKSLEGPAGQPFASVQRREEVYTGPRTEYAPDIILKQAPKYVIGSQHPRGETFIPADERRIDHTRHGLLVGAGPDISSNWIFNKTPSIMDVTPTLLHLLDITLDKRFDGHVLRPLMSKEEDPVSKTYESFEPESKEEFSEIEEAELRDRLQDMGYLK